MAHIMHNHLHTHRTFWPDNASQLRLAHNATWHCLMGCGLGEVVGIIIGTALGLPSIQTLTLAIALGFVFGMWPLLRAGYDFSRAVRQVFIAETLSIVVMEVTEVLVQIYTPGVMEAGLISWIFWAGMGLALTAGYIAAFPVNYVLVGKGIRHIH